MYIGENSSLRIILFILKFFVLPIICLLSLRIKLVWPFKILFLEKYDYVGRLLKPGESHSYYTDEEETPTNKLHLKNPKQCEPETTKDKDDDPLDKVNTEDKNTTDDIFSNPAKLDDSLTLDK